MVPRPDIPVAGHIEGEHVGIDAHQVVSDRVDDVDVDLLGLLDDPPPEDAVRPRAARSRACGV